MNRYIFQFSKEEVYDLIISVLFTAIIFLLPVTVFSPVSILIKFITITIIVSSAFVTHELAHKFVGIKNGFFARYKMYMSSTLMSFFISALTFFQIKFVATGAVEIYPTEYSNFEKLWEIAAAGPTTNLLVGWIGVIGLLLTKMSIFYLIAVINFYIGLFNMIPIPPLDGSKVIRDNPMAYVILTIGLFLSLVLAL